MRLGARARIGFVVVVLVGVLFAFVFPTRSYYEQRRQISLAEHRLAVLQAQNAVLHKEAQRLGSDAEVERLARSLYNLVKPGERAYAVVPVAPAPVPGGPGRVAAPDPDRVAGDQRGGNHGVGANHKAASAVWYRRVWHSIVGIL